MHVLNIYDGVLRAGYGDYGANTGPIHVLAMDLADISTVADEATLHTEQISQYVPTSLGLLCPFMDPQEGIGNPEQGSYAIRQSNGTWTTYAQVMDPYPVHVFDACETTEGIFAVGSSQVGDVTATYGQIWLRRADTGIWESSLQVQAVTDDWNRFTACCTLDGQVLAWMVNIDANDTTLYRRSEGAWTQVSVDPYSVGLALAWSFSGTPLAFCTSPGRLVGLPGSESAVTAAQAAFDALSVYPILACISSDDLYLYVYGLDRRVFRHNSTSWSYVGTVGGTSSINAMAVDADTAYFGTTDSKVFAVSLATLQP